MYPMILVFVAVSPSCSCSGWSFRRLQKCSMIWVRSCRPSRNMLLTPPTGSSSPRLYVVVVFIVAAIGFKQFRKTEAGRLYVGGLLMVLPSVGELMIGMAMYKFSSSIALLLKSGVPMMETMNTVTGIFQGQPRLPCGTGTSPFAGGGGQTPVCRARGDGDLLADGRRHG